MGNSQRTLCMPAVPLNYILWVINLVPVPITILVIGFGLTNLGKINPKKLRIAYFIAFFVVLVGQIIVPLHSFMDFEFSQFCDDFKRKMITAQIVNASWALSMFCVDVVFALRLYVFKSSANLMSIGSKVQLCVVTCILVVHFTATMLALRFSLLFWDAFFRQDPAAASYLSALMTCGNVWISAHLLNSLLLVIFFTRDIKRICVNARHTIKNTDEVPAVIRRVIHLPIRYALCLTLSFITSLNDFIYLMIWMSLENTNTLYQINLIFASWDICMTLLAVVLQLESFVSDKIYYNLCQCGVNKLEQTFINRVLKAMRSADTTTGDGERPNQMELVMVEANANKKMPSKQTVYTLTKSCSDFTTTEDTTASGRADTTVTERASTTEIKSLTENEEI